MLRTLTNWGFSLVLLSPSLAYGQLGDPTAPASTHIIPPRAADGSVAAQAPEPTKVAAEPVPTAKEQDKLTAFEQKLDALSKNLTITTADPNIKVVFGGVIDLDLLYSSKREVAPGTPFFLTSGPPPGFHQQTFDANSRPTTLFAQISGPDFCGFQTSALIMACFYSSSLIEDLYGVRPVQAYSQLKNDDWRIAAGLQFDIFNPLNPNVLPFSYLAGSGNAGLGFPAQFRVERYIHLDDDAQVTLTGGLAIRCRPPSATSSESARTIVGQISKAAPSWGWGRSPAKGLRRVGRLRSVSREWSVRFGRPSPSPAMSSPMSGG
jgi:hypothetical protein